jgi:hypothetical protein
MPKRREEKRREEKRREEKRREEKRRHLGDVGVVGDCGLDSSSG